VQPDRVYLALALAFGAAYVVLTPPGQVADEPAHFRRAFELSEGRVVAQKQGDYTGDEQPRAIDRFEDRYRHLFLHYEEKLTRADILDSASVRIESDDRTFAPFANTAIHSPLTYAPQAAAIFVARHVSGSVLVCWYSGRAANLLAVTLLTFLAIRVAPAGKWFLAAVALTPMALSLAASLSSDALTNAFAFLLVAHGLALALGPREHIAGRSIAVMVLLGVAVGLCKQGYFFLPLCYLMVPPARFGSRFRYWVTLTAALAATLVAVGAWGGVVREVYSRSDPQFGMNPPEQFRAMREHPLEFLSTLLHTSRSAVLYAEEFVGWLGYADLRLATPVYLVELIVLVTAAALGFGPRSGVGVRQASVAAGVAVLIAFTLAVIVHITWDAVGASTIGLQGRYFIPIAPLAGVAVGRVVGGLATRLPASAVRVAPVAVAAAVPFVLVAGLARVHERFFVDNPKAASQRAFGRAMAYAKEGQEKLAREQLEEALRLYSGHAPARFQLGSLVASQGEYAEAIRLFREALELNPGDVNVQRRLATVVEAEQARQQLLVQVPQFFQGLIAANGLAEERHRDTPEAGLYLKASRGRVTDPSGRAPFPFELVWRCPTSAGEDVRLSGAPERHAAPFFACTAMPLIGPKRLFVFPPPVNAALFKDEEVSWLFQRPMAELSPTEREREEEYRRQHGLHFPLASLAD
jgi:uncharacterized membrane protein